MSATTTKLAHDPARPASQSRVPDAAAARAHDLRGGLVSWLGSIYIVVLIPVILGLDGQHTPVTSVATTALACAVGTLLFALLTRLPFAVGPGIVPASIVATFVASGIPFSTVLGIELLAGLLFVLLVATGAVQRLVHATPPVLKHAGEIAIGLYLLLAALRATGILQNTHGDDKLVLGTPGLLFLAGLATVFLVRRWPRVSGYALLVGMAVATAGAAALGLVSPPGTVFQMPAITWVMPDVMRALDLGYIDEILILLYVVIVDVVATLETIATCSPELRGEDGRLRRWNPALMTSAVVFLASPLLGSVPMLVFFESLGGVLSGARTRWAALVCALGFFVVVFVAPLASLVPAFACAVALGFVGCMITQHAATALPAAASDPTGATLGRQLASLAVIVMVVSHSVALTLFVLFALYPAIAIGAGLRPARGTVAAAMASALLVGLMLT